jgi:hypothetical protein
VAVAKNKFAKGFDGTERKVRDAYEILPVQEALQRVYPTDAHLVTYVVKRAQWQPRINKPGLVHFDGIVETGVFFCDVDNPGHAEWTDGLVESAMREYETLPVLAAAGIYHTAHGRRIVQPVAKPIPIDQAEAYLGRWLSQLEAAGLAVDWNCRDWTRHFRLPHVQRAGRDYRSPHVLLERMVPVPLEPIVELRADPSATADRKGPRLPIPAVAWTTELPTLWHPRVERIAEAVRRTEGNWHELFLALAGALLSRGVPHEHVPTMVREISIATCADTRVEDRELAARTTVQRHLTGNPITGYATILRRWPVVADAINAALATGMQARIRSQLEEPADLPACSLEETTAALENAIRHAPDGLTLIKAECGLGKTAAIRRIAKERADKPYVSPKAQGLRAPSQSKTSISVDKNSLAIQITQDLRGAGAAVRRLFGPLSVFRADGTPECRLYENALPLVQGGQSIQREFCLGRGKEQCEHYETCRARDGSEGPANARILVGPHALLSALNGEAGVTGLLVIDEPPALLKAEELTVADFDAALCSLDKFDLQYGHAVRPALRALRAWAETVAPVGEVRSPLDALRGGFEHVSPAELKTACHAADVKGLAGAEAIVECVRGSFPEDHRGTAPPILRVHVFAARRLLDLSSELGAASRVLRTVHDAVTSTAPVAVRVEVRGAKRVLAVTSMRVELVEAVKREGAVVVADANVELHAPLLAKVVGYEPPMHTFSAPDGAPIARTLLCSWSATRKKWLPKGKLDWDAGIPQALATVVSWAKEDANARELGIITFLPLAVALRATLQPGDASVEEAWKDAGQRPEELARCREVLEPVLAGWPGRVVVGHYGAIRGLDHMKHLDALATLGDPWPNLGAVQHDIAFLGLAEAWEARVEVMCRAELEQAHGRLRTVHRTRPGRALHVGRVLPSGSGWKDGKVEIRENRGGRPPNVRAMSALELVEIVNMMGGIRATARAVGCSAQAISRYSHGVRVVPDQLASQLRALRGRSEHAA